MPELAECLVVFGGNQRALVGTAAKSKGFVHQVAFIESLSQGPPG